MKLPLTITKQGVSALIDAGAGTTNKVRIAEIALTAQHFVQAPTLEAVPGEFKRLSTVSGEAVSEDVLHMVCSDDDAETYTVAGFGLYTDTGVLFGVYSQAQADGPLFEKSAAATFLLAADIAFQAGEAGLIEFGDANFLYPPATETRKGVAYLATAADFAGAGDAEKILTPKRALEHFVPQAWRSAVNGVAALGPDGRVPPSQLPPVDSIDTFTVDSEAQMLAAPATPGDFARRTDLQMTFVLRAAPATTLANWQEFLSPGAPVRSVNAKIGDVVLGAADVGAAPVGRQITGGGLVTGGGNLGADRQLTVAIADAAETLAGLINDKAVTPASLATLLGQLAGKAPAARRVDTAGLATGGGDLSQNRTITVTAASAADVEGMTDNTRAVTAAALAGTLRNFGPTGLLRIPGSPLILMWGQVTFNGGSASNGQANQFKPFTWAFPSACYHVFITPQGNMDSGDESDETAWVPSVQASGFQMSCRGDWPTVQFSYFALGV